MATAAPRPPVGTVVIGPFGTIEQVDDGACALLGYAKTELLGMHGSEIIPPERRTAVAAAIDQMRHGDFAFVDRAFVLRRDGAVLSVEVRARRLPNARLALSLHPQPAGSST